MKEVRGAQPDGGLGVATDQGHAHRIGELSRWEFRVGAAMVTSDDPSASEHVASFAASGTLLVAMRMVPEGFDIPRRRVGVYATATTTELVFRQAVGRFVRWEAGVRNQRAWLYVPDDPRLRVWAVSTASQRRHSLARDQVGSPRTRIKGVTNMAADELEQLSLFAPLSAVAMKKLSVSPANGP